MAKQRSVNITRKTNETDIEVSLNLDGIGSGKIASGIPFFDHMLELFSKHGFFDLNINAKGDIDIDYHHLVEDMGITLGQAFKKALGEAKEGCPISKLLDTEITLSITLND